MNPIKDPIRRIFPSFSLSYQNFDNELSFHQNLDRVDVDIWQLSAGRFQGNLIKASSNQVQIERHFYNVLLKSAGTPPKHWTFGIPVHPLCLLFEQKYQLEDNYILMGSPQSCYDIIEKSAYEIFVIYFTEEFLLKLCQDYHLPDLPQLLGEAYYHPSAMRCSREQLRVLRRAIRQFFRQGF